MKSYKKFLIKFLVIIIIVIIGILGWFNVNTIKKIVRQDNQNQQVQLNYGDQRVELDKIELESTRNLLLTGQKNKKEKIIIEKIVNNETREVVNNKILKVPFTVQAPYGDWKNDIYQDGCEEASVLMAIYWINGKELTKVVADEKIVAMAEWQENKYGCAVDTSTKDTVKRLFNEYFGYKKVETKTVEKVNDLINEIKQGRLIIVPTNGQLLGNPYYTSPGPLRHNLVVYGYDKVTDEFIVNDPGTKRGGAYRYSSKILFEAIRDYSTGCHIDILKDKKVMIVVKK